MHNLEGTITNESNSKFNFRNIIKFIITLTYLLSTIWVSKLTFNYMFDTASFSADGNKVENVLLIQIYSVLLSALAVFFLGMLSLFTHFVYIKLIYGNEVKNAALALLNKKRFSNKKEIENSTTNSEEVTQINS